VLSGIRPAFGNFPWLLFVAGVAFLLGLVGPRVVYHRLLARIMH
jgi:hypothetical protein